MLYYVKLYFFKYYLDITYISYTYLFTQKRGKMTMFLYQVLWSSVFFISVLQLDYMFKYDSEHLNDTFQYNNSIKHGHRFTYPFNTF